MDGLPAQPTAAQLATFLRADGTAGRESTFLEISPSWYAGMASWTASERDEVLNAAVNNASVRRVHIDPHTMSLDVAGEVARIVGKLRYMYELSIFEGSNVPPDVVDTLLRRIIDSTVRIRLLGLRSHGSPTVLRDFMRRFPDVTVLDFLAPPVGDDGDFGAEDFATGVAAAVGQLSSLQRLSVCCKRNHAALQRLLTAVCTASTVTHLLVTCIALNSTALLTDVRHFCHHTTSLHSLFIKHISSPGIEFLDVTAFLEPDQYVSATITAMHFYQCTTHFLDDHLPLRRRAAVALKGLNVLAFYKCRMAGAFELLTELPRLTTFYCLSRESKTQPGQTLDDEFDDSPYMLGTNTDLASFCSAIERRESSLCLVQLDCVSRSNESFPALERLLRGSKGELVLNLGNVPRETCQHLVMGAFVSEPALHTLRIHFCRSRFSDTDYAALLRAVASNETYRTFELGFDRQSNLGTPPHSIAAIRKLVKSNDTLHTLALKGLNSDAVAALLESILPLLTSANRSLRLLSLGGVDLTGHWHRLQGPMIAMLEENTTLSSLDGCQLPEIDATVVQVRFLLKQNRYGRQLFRKPAPTPIRILGALLPRPVKDNEFSVVYAFLRSKPELVQTKIRRNA